LVEKFEKVKKYIVENRKKKMYDRRASNAWMHPVLPKCESCGKCNAMQPLITKKRNINWLFLLLGQMIGCCELEHLRYFCKHSNIKFSRSVTKDRLVYLTYVALCNQVQPGGPVK
jgi:hypothetical protein